MKITQSDKNVLRELAKRYREVAEDPVMEERKRAWKSLHSLKPERPVAIFEPYFLDNFLRDYPKYTLKCETELARNVETMMVTKIFQFEELEDDIVLEPHFGLGWQGVNMNSTGTDFGDIKIVEHKAKEETLAYLSDFPIKTPGDVKRMTPRQFKVDRDGGIAARDALNEVFGDILPVTLGNFDNFDPGMGNQPFLGNFFIGVTWDLFKLIGAEAMMLWPFDHPEALNEVLDFLIDDKTRFFDYLVSEKLIRYNTDDQLAGPSCYGYVDDLPSGEAKGDVALKDLWTWSESQECEMLSPEMFDEFYLPHMAALANKFGLSYYGCCEQVDKKWNNVTKHIKNIRIVSVSNWTNPEAMAEKLGKNYVFSKKPFPAYVSSPTADWDAVEKDAKRVAAAVKKEGCPTEVILRDVYSTTCTPLDRAKRWVKIWKEAMEIV